MQSTTCVLCNIVGGKVEIRENGYTGVRCPDCGLIYISPRPSEEEIDSRYKGYQESTGGLYEIDTLKKKLFARHALAKIQEWKSTGSLLEIGAGTGEFLVAAQEAGYKVEGTELDQGAAEFIESELGIRCYSQPLSELPFSEKTFDVIYHRNVLSHFYNPVEALKRVHELLDDTGIMVFETGNYAEVDDEYYSEIPSFQYPDHLFLFGECSLRKLLYRSGFNIQRIYRYSKRPLFTIEESAMTIGKWMRGGTDGDQEIRVDGSQTLKGKAFNVAIKFLSNSWYLAQHILVYVVGGRIPKEGHPQTVIVVTDKVRP